MQSTSFGNPGVGSWIERRARSASDDAALVTVDRTFTYGELAKRVRRLAQGLRDLGVAHGDRVGWLGPNHSSFLESFFAAGLIGAALAPVNHTLDAVQIASILQDTEPTVLIQNQIAARASIPHSIRHRIAVDHPQKGMLDFEALVAESPDDLIDEPVAPEELCFLPHTSGTTGKPKAVMLTHGNVLSNVVNFLTCADFRSDDITIAIAPFFRVGGTGVNVLPVLFMGGTVVIPRDVDTEGLLQLFESHRITVGFGNPDILDALARSELWPTSDLSSIRFILTGGAPVPARLIRTYRDRGLALLQGYGLSEAAPLALLLDPESALRKMGSAGRPPLLVDARIIAPDGTILEPGEVGELEVRGPNIMAGYWRRPEETRPVLSSDGWLRTGDAARRDTEGYYWIVDRASDRFITDGRTVYPGEVERVFMEHPAIADVGAVGVPHQGRGQVGAAFVVLVKETQVTEQQLLEFSRLHLAPHQIPASVTIVDRLPRNSVGKLIRGQLRAPQVP